MASSLKRTVAPDHRTCFRTVAVWLALFSYSVPAHAQDGLPPRWDPPAAGEAAFLGANTLLGALTGGVLQVMRGGSFSDGFTRGALGGAVVYGGKRLGVGRFDGAGFLGREIAAVGTSIVHNAAAGRPSLELLVLPLGPTRLHVQPNGGRKVRATIDLYQMAWLAFAVVEPELSFNAAKTLSAGAPVFVAQNRRILSDGRPVSGVTGAGTILLSDRGVLDKDATFAHERVHVAQLDFFYQAWFAPLEDLLLRRTGLSDLFRHVDINVTTPLLLSLQNAIDRNNRPTELEADFLDIR